MYAASRAAFRPFASGMVASKAAALLKSKSRTDSDAVHYVTWFPAHMGHSVLPGHPNQ